MALKFSKLIADKAGVSSGGKFFHRLVKFLSSAGLTYALCRDESSGVQYYKLNALGENTDSDVVIADNIDGILVTHINSYVGGDSKNLVRSIYIPDSVTYIASDAFRYYPNLTEVTISRSVTSIGEWAFSDNPSLKTVYYNAESAETSANISYSPFSTSSETTSSYNNLDVIIGKYVKTIPHKLFAGHSSYKVRSGVVTVTFKPNSNSISIGEYAFYRCSALKSVVFPEGPLEIGEDAFQSCSALEKIIIPNATTIGTTAFAFCSSATEIDVSCQHIKNNAFQDCNSVKNVTIRNCQTMGDSAFSNCNVSSVTTHDCQIIGFAAFSRQTKLTKVVLHGCTTVDRQAFYECTNLTSLTLYNTLTTLNRLAFGSCTKLESITFVGTMEQWNSIEKDTAWNNGSTKLTTIHCTDGDVTL